LYEDFVPSASFRNVASGNARSSPYPSQLNEPGVRAQYHRPRGVRAGFLAVLTCLFPIVLFAQSSPAVLTAPAPGSVLTSTSATFSWTAGVGVTAYGLFLGTTGPGSHNLLNQPATTATSVHVTGLPANGVKIYVRAWSLISGTWQHTDYTCTEKGTPVLAALTAPAPGSTLTGTSATFSWTTGAGPTAYDLWIGTTGVGSYNVYSTSMTSATSANVTGLPATGATLYVRLLSYVSGVWQGVDYIYTEAGVPVIALLTSPAPGSTLPGATVTFSWTPGAGVTQYQIWLGTTGAGSQNLGILFPGASTPTSGTATGLPTSGATLYARLWSEVGLIWLFKDYTFTAAGGAAEVELSWEAPASSSDPIAGYNIYRAPAGSSAYHLLNAAIDTSTTYVDSTVQAGQTYEYMVESVDESGVQSAPSNEAAVTVP